MKTNLDKIFKTDDKLEVEGIWLDISEETGFLVRRFGGANTSKFSSAMAKHYAPYARLIENKTLDRKKEDEIMIKVFVDACLIDWKGVQIDGVDTPCSPEIAIQFLMNLPELAKTLIEYSRESKNFLKDVGNS